MGIFLLFKEDVLRLFGKKLPIKSIDEEINDLLVRVWFIGMVDAVIGALLLLHLYKILYWGKKMRFIFAGVSYWK